MLVTIWALILETFGDFMVDFTQARQNMVDCQLRTNQNVDDNLINAFSSVPRELFVEYKFQAMRLMSPTPKGLRVRVMGLDLD